MGSLYKRTPKLTDDGTERAEWRKAPWWIKYYQGGRAVRESTGTNKDAVARRMLRAREGDVERGIPITPKMGRVTFEDAAKDLLNDYKTNKKRSHDDTKRRIDLHLEPFFRGKLLVSITTATVRAYVAQRQDETVLVTPSKRVKTKGIDDVILVPEVRRPTANGTINRELSALKRMFSLAIKAGTLHGKPDIPKLREANPRQGFFEPAQFEAVRGHLPAALRPVVTFAYLTGWRLKSEILPLEWRQVDWHGRVVRLDPGTTKNREGRSFPFTAALDALLKQQLAEHEALKRAGRIVPITAANDYN